MTKTMFASALIGATLLSSAAFAQPAQIQVQGSSLNDSTQTAVVYTKDLDLTNRAGQGALRVRVAQAVNHVCTFSGSIDHGCTGPATADARVATDTLIASANGRSALGAN